MKKFLVAYDGSDPSKRALEQAADLAKLTGATISVVSVIPVHPGRAPVDPWDDREVHTKELLEAKAFLSGRGIEPDLIEPAGNPARTIERIAGEGGYDTVIIGSRGLSAAGRVLQGSVSEHVATHFHGTVIVVH